MRASIEVGERMVHPYLILGTPSFAIAVCQCKAEVFVIEMCVLLLQVFVYHWGKSSIAKIHNIRLMHVLTTSILSLTRHKFWFVTLFNFDDEACLEFRCNDSIRLGTVGWVGNFVHIRKQLAATRTIYMNLLCLCLFFRSVVCIGKPHRYLSG